MQALIREEAVVGERLVVTALLPSESADIVDDAQNADHASLRNQKSR